MPWIAAITSFPLASSLSRQHLSTELMGPLAKLNIRDLPFSGK
jgi:hypothetical protein